MATIRVRRNYPLFAWLLANVLVGLLWGYTRQLELSCGPTLPDEFACVWIQPGPQLTLPMAAL